MNNNYVITSFEIGNIKIKVILDRLLQLAKKTPSEMHNHATYELHLVNCGCAEFATERRNVTLNEFDTVIVYPDVFHMFTKEEKGTTSFSIRFSFTKTKKANCLDYYTLITDEFAKRNDFFYVPQNELLKEYISNIIKFTYSLQPFSEDKAKANFVLFFSELVSQMLSNSNNDFKYGKEYSEYDTRIALIESFFNELYMEDLTLSRLADILHLSEKQANRMVNKAFGTNFKQQLNKTRIRNAKKLLRETNTDINEISYKVGYHSYNGFYLAFKKNTGITPVEYRKINSCI